MGDSKRKNKKVKQKQMPNPLPRTQWTPSPKISRRSDPDNIMTLRPVWRFTDCDTGLDCGWSFHKKRLGEKFWDVIFPKLREFETMTWSDILLKGKKQNHSIAVDSLNKVAQERLEALQIEAEDVYSLRLGGKLRLYGLLIENVYHILWFDDDHEDNTTCVCRSKKKHT